MPRNNKLTNVIGGRTTQVATAESGRLFIRFDDGPTMRVKKLAALSKGCGRPSELRVTRGKCPGLPVLTVPAMTASQGGSRLGLIPNSSHFRDC